MKNDEMYLNFGNLYNDYERIVKDPNPRLILNMDKIYEEILKEYSNPDNIISICSFNELITLRECTSSDYEFPNKDIKFLLENKHLLKNYPNEKMNKKLVEYINKALRNLNVVEIKRNEKINYFILGYIRVMGLLTINEVTSLLVKQKYFTDEEKALHYIKNNKFFNYYAKFDNNNIRWRDYEDYVIDELLINKSKVQHFELNEIDEALYSRIFEKGYDYTNPYIITMYEELNKYAGLFSFMTLDMNICILTGCSRVLILGALDRYNEITKIDDIVKMNSVISDAIDNSPSGCLYGLTPIEYDIKLKGYC